VAREIKVEKKSVHTTSRHKAMVAKAKNGYIEIRKRDGIRKSDRQIILEHKST